ETGEKITKAKEWNVPIVNYNWLLECYFGKMANIDLPQYQLGAPAQEVNTTPYALEQIDNLHRHMLLGWHALMPQEHQRLMQSQKLQQELQAENVFPNLKYREIEAPSEEDIIEANEKRRKSKRPPHRFALCGFEQDVAERISKQIRFLGAEVVKDVEQCTHLVVLNGKRSVPLLKAIAIGAFVVRPEYILTSYESGKWQDAIAFLMKDDDSERMHGYNLKASIIRARNARVLQGIRIYITPSVDPSRATLQRLVELSGGEVDAERPTARQVGEHLERDGSYLIIGAEADVKLVEYLVEAHIPIYSPEFIFQAILRQEIDASSALRIVYPRPAPPQPPQPAQPTPQPPTSAQKAQQGHQPQVVVGRPGAQPAARLTPGPAPVRA
ncbi:unnamed protein product, partial [Mesorhabditis spiculigera]